MATGTLTGQTIANTYKSLLKITGTTAGGETLHATTQKVIEDGDGNPFPLSAAQDAIMITSTNRLEFGDDASYIHQSADGVLDLVSDTEIEINATTIDINGKVIMSVDSATDNVIIESVDGGTATAPDLVLYRNSASPADNDYIGQLLYRGRNDNSQDVSYVEIDGVIIDASDGTEDGALYMFTMANGSQVNTMTLDRGKVGIGESSALYVPLTVAVNSSSVFTAGSVDGVNIILMNKSTGTCNTGIKAIDGSSSHDLSAIIFGQTGQTSGDEIGHLEFWTSNSGDSGNTEKMRITDNGTVRINNGVAYSMLNNAGNGTLNSLWAGGSDQLNIGNDAGWESIRFLPGAAEKIRITPIGHLGIGCTPSDSYHLHIEDSSSPIIAVQDTTNNVVAFMKSDNDSTEFGSLSDHNMDLRTNNTARLTIDTSGGVYINDDSNSKSTIGLTINQGGNDNEAFALKSSDVAHGMTDLTETDTYFTISKASAGEGGVNCQAFADNVEYAYYIQGATLAGANTAKSTSAAATIVLSAAVKSSAGRGAVGSDGNCVSISNFNTTRFIFDGEGSGHADVEWTTYSDGRLKTDRETIPYGLDEINKLKPQRYKRQSGGFDEDGNLVLEDNKKTEIGFIAQEIKEIIPELVKDIDESESLYSLNDGKIVAVLVKAVQELSAKVKALEDA